MPERHSYLNKKENCVTFSLWVSASEEDCDLCLHLLNRRRGNWRKMVEWGRGRNLVAWVSPLGMVRKSEGSPGQVVPLKAAGPALSCQCSRQKRREREAEENASEGDPLGGDYGGGENPGLRRPLRIPRCSLMGMPASQRPSRKKEKEVNRAARVTSL